MPIPVITEVPLVTESPSRICILDVYKRQIEPHASGHIIEQIELVEEILKNGYAYESEGSVYFDVEKYNKAQLRETTEYLFESGAKE